MAIKLAIVEDHHVTRGGLLASLSAESDITVVGAAATAGEGIELCRQMQPDVVLLDLHLPDFEGVKPLVDSFAAVAPRILIFSAEGRRAFVDAAMSLPIAGYLSKSENLPAIVDAIRRAHNGEVMIVSPELAGAEKHLTPAEKELLRLLAQGYKYESIGHLRKTSGATVKKQCERLLVKLDLGTREELISWAALHGYADSG